LNGVVLLLPLGFVDVFTNDQIHRRQRFRFFDGDIYDVLNNRQAAVLAELIP
jgi:hypothetical protein